MLNVVLKKYFLSQPRERGCPNAAQRHWGAFDLCFF
jgi:hypothetical protein